MIQVDEQEDGSIVIEDFERDEPDRYRLVYYSKADADQILASLLAMKKPEVQEALNDVAVKKDSGKLRYDLIPAGALKVLAQIVTFGATKYGDRNWEKGFNYGRLYAATMRHIQAFWAGEDNDPETGLPHMGHAAFGCFALVHHLQNGVGLDDRPGLIKGNQFNERVIEIPEPHPAESVVELPAGGVLMDSGPFGAAASRKWIYPTGNYQVYLWEDYLTQWRPLYARTFFKGERFVISECGPGQFWRIEQCDE